MASNLTKEGSSSEGGFFSGLGQKMYDSSVGEKGGFASKVIGGVATGSASRDGVISGEKAVDAFNAYMGPAGGIPAAAAVEEAEPGSGMQPTVGQTPMDGHIPMTPEGNTEDGMDTGVPPVEVPTEEGAADRIPMRQEGEDAAAMGEGDPGAESFAEGGNEQIPMQMEETAPPGEGTKPAPEIPYTLEGNPVEQDGGSEGVPEMPAIGAGTANPTQEAVAGGGMETPTTIPISEDGGGTAGASNADIETSNAVQGGSSIPATPATPTASASSGSKGDSHTDPHQPQQNQGYQRYQHRLR